jgi:hypothetical protein
MQKVGDVVDLLKVVELKGNISLISANLGGFFQTVPLSFFWKIYSLLVFLALK